MNISDQQNLHFSKDFALPFILVLRHLFASYKLNLEKTPSHGQAWLRDVCASFHSLWEFRERPMEQVAMRGFKQNSWEACLPRVQHWHRARHQPHPGPQTSALKFRHQRLQDQKSTLLHNLIWFYWIIDIWMTFNKLIVRRKQKNDHRPGYHGLLSQAPYLGPACHGSCSLQGCPSWPWQLTLGKGQERLFFEPITTSAHFSLPSPPNTVCLFSQTSFHSFLFFSVLIFSFSFFLLAFVRGCSSVFYLANWC